MREHMRQALELALKALEGVLDDAPKVLEASIAGGLYEVIQCRDAITAIKEALAQPEQKPVANGKLKVTLQDTPTEIELAQYKRMLEAACSALGAIGEALGVDEDEGGAEPILAAIEELKAQHKEPDQEPVAYGTWDTMLGKGHRMMMVRLDKGQDGCTVSLYTTPPQRTWVGLTDEHRLTLWLKTESEDVDRYAFAKAIEAKLKEKNT